MASIALGDGTSGRDRRAGEQNHILSNLEEFLVDRAKIGAESVKLYIMAALDDLGVQGVDDLQFITAADLHDVGMKAVHERKFAKVLDTMDWPQESGSERADAAEAYYAESTLKLYNVALGDLGVEGVDDLQYITAADLRGLGMKTVHERRFAKVIEAMDWPQDGPGSERADKTYAETTLKRYKAALDNLGVESVDDLQFITAPDLRGLGMKAVHERKFAKLIPMSRNEL